MWANVEHVAPHAIGRGLSASTSRQVSGTGFERSWPPRSSPVPRVPRAFRPVEYRPTAHGARAAQRGLGVVVLWANAEHISPHTAGRDATAQKSWQVSSTTFEILSHQVQIPWRASRALFVLWRFGSPPTEHAPGSADLAWLCCRSTRSTFFPALSARARPHQNRGRLAAQPSRGLGHRVQIPWRASRVHFALQRFDSPPTEHTPRSADLAWLCCGPTRSIFLLTLLAGARPHQNRGRSAARPSS